ncbi:hypothetical protein [Streptomyces chartreusis]
MLPPVGHVRDCSATEQWHPVLPQLVKNANAVALVPAAYRSGAVRLSLLGF